MVALVESVSRGQSVSSGREPYSNQTKCPSYGCTSFLIKAIDGSVLHGRTMDFPLPDASKSLQGRAQSLPSTMLSGMEVYCAGVDQTSTKQDGTAGFSWTPTYSYVGITAFGMIQNPNQGMNNKGLTAGMLTHHGAQYSTNGNLNMPDVLPWILGTCATVADVKEAFAASQATIWCSEIPALGGVPGLHIAVHDAAGASLVIEFKDGLPVLSDNPIGVLTNDPGFEWHLQHLDQFNNLTQNPASDNKINGESIPGAGTGSGMQGLPGSFSSEDRFVRTVKMIQFATQPSNVQEALQLAVQMTGLVSIPNGVVVAYPADPVKQTAARVEHTWWTVFEDLTNQVVYYTVKGDPTLHRVDLKEITFDRALQYRSLSLEPVPITSIDETKNLLPARFLEDDGDLGKMSEGTADATQPPQKPLTDGTLPGRNVLRCIVS